MRKLIVSEFITLDGCIAKSDGQMDFFNQFPSDRKLMIESQKDWDLLFMGRTTYETMVQFWPNSNDSRDEIAKFMNEVPKKVLSASLKKAPWGKYTEAAVISKDIPGIIKELKTQPGKNMALLGSAVTARYFFDHDLVDELFLLVYPIVLGKGKSLFEGIAGRKNLHLLESKTLDSGIVLLKYELVRKK